MDSSVILCPNPYKDTNLEITVQLMNLLKNAGFKVEISPEFLDEIEAREPDGVEFKELDEVINGAALVVSLGGDGTIMHTARRMIGHRIPIIGVNLGTVGFLAELESFDIARVVTAAQGYYTPSPRMMLKVEVLREGKTVFSDYALNDVSLNGVAQTISITACGDGRKILKYSGDGIVVATPTGSTAYSMSAGGPLVEPTAENIILTPVCPHALAARSFVLAPDRIVTVEVKGLRCTAIMSVDGGHFELKEGDVLRAQKSEYQTMLAHVGSKGFYDIVFEKLGDTI